MKSKKGLKLYLFLPFKRHKANNTLYLPYFTGLALPPFEPILISFKLSNIQMKRLNLATFAAASPYYQNIALKSARLQQKPALVWRNKTLSHQHTHRAETMTTFTTKILKTAAIAALITGFANSASALDIINPLTVPGSEIELFDGQALSQTTPKTPILPSSAKIAVARLDQGRMITTTYSEESDWKLLDERTDVDVSMLSYSDYLNYVPAVPLHIADSYNGIDEVRMTAAMEGYSHVILYGTGRDAAWNSFGSRAIEETGLTMDPSLPGTDVIWKKTKAKAILVNSFTGEVLGAVSADNQGHNIGELADNVDRLMIQLSEV